MRRKPLVVGLTALLVAACGSAGQTAGPSTSVPAPNATPVATLVATTTPTAAPASTAPASASPTPPTSPSQPPVLATVPVPGIVFNLVFDAKRNSLLFPIYDGPNSKLFEYPISTGKLKSWPLPDTEHNGFLGSIVVAPDGSVYLADSYSLIRVDRTSGAVKSRKLPWKDTDMVPDALTSNISPGTWTSALMLDAQGQVVLGRHNVNALIYLNTILRETKRVALPKELGGVGTAVQQGGFFYVAPSTDGAMAIVDNAGHVTWGPAGVRSMATGSDGVIAISWHGERILLRGSTTVSTAPFKFLAVVAAKDSEIDYSPTGGPGFMQRSRDGVALASFPLHSKSVDVVNPLGQTVAATEVEQIQALAVDGQDHVWAVVSDPTGGPGKSYQPGISLVELPI